MVVRTTALLASFGAAVALGQPANFQPLPSSFVEARAISGDGTTVVGHGTFSSKQAPAKWTAAGGVELLGTLPDYRGEAFEVSRDGSVITGYEDYYPSGDTQPFRWTSKEGRVSLGFSGTARGISGDGRTIVGYAPHQLPNGSAGSQAFRWTPEAGRIDMGFLPGSTSYAQSTTDSVNSDGSVIIGAARKGTAGGWDTFRWTPGEGMVAFPPPASMADASAFRLSAGGDAMVGNAAYDSLGNRYPARWTSATGWAGIDPFPGGSTAGLSSAVRGVSADGSVIVGNYGSDAFIWTAERGTRKLSDVLLSLGVTNLTGWQLQAALDVSDDGRVIVGSAINSTGTSQQFVATIPSPSGGAVLAVLALIAGTNRRRRARDTGYGRTEKPRLA